MKIFLILIFTAFPFTALWANTTDFTYTAVIFGDNNPETIAIGHLDAATFEKEFVTVYPLAGLRLEIPKGSAPFGALFLYSDTQILTMPFYHFLSPTDCYKCQGRANTGFEVWENTQMAFITTIKMKLRALENHTKK